MDGDRPLTKKDDDRLGFTPVADHLAQALLDQSVKDGLVVGIEGKWGSGKSSLINLTIEALRNGGHGAPEVITFSPWLVGARDELLLNLFDELATSATKIEPIESDEVRESLQWWQRLHRWAVGDQYWRLRRRQQLKKKIGQKLKAFGILAGTFGKAAKLAGWLGVPGADLAGTAVERTRDAVQEFPKTESLVRQKSDLVDALRLLSRRIVVFVDDLDRLEPSEACEVLRLIRAVADFPNVIYIVSYDPDVVAATLAKAIQVDDGKAFLEKIVQVSFRVPYPEAFDLRRWFQLEVNEIFASELRDVTELRPRVKERLAYSIDALGARYLKTPRDVVRALNALRLHAIPVRSRIDIPDMVWLQLVRIGDPALYDWIEEYLTEVAAISHGATVSRRAAERSYSRLSEILNKEDADIDRAIIEIGEILPGVEQSYVSRDEVRQVFNNLRDDVLQPFVADRRLGSPYHYRYYYAFSEPGGILRDEEVTEFVTLAESQPNEATQSFARLASTSRSQGGTMAEVMIDRLYIAADQIPPAAVPGIVSAMADSMDLMGLLSRDADFGQPRAWSSARRLVARLLRRTSGDIREASIRNLFAIGRALGWLTSIFRSETFSHGYCGNRKEPEDEWLLNAAEFEDVRMTMLRRYQETPPQDLLRVPNLLGVLFGWQQGGGEEEARRWVADRIETDTGLLALLSRVRGWVSSSNIGVHYPIRRRELSYFLDFDDAERRVRAISANELASEADRRLALELMVAIGQGERH